MSGLSGTVAWALWTFWKSDPQCLIDLAREPPNPWVTLGKWASIALGIPLVVLVLGSSLVWAFSGFAAKRP